jgi:putative restriction endonuclease
MAIFDWLSIQVNLKDHVLDWQLLSNGFSYNGLRVPLLGRQGIWKPAILEKYPISITTKSGSGYNDQVTKDSLILYHYRGQNPDHHDNRSLREAMINRIPLIYFYWITKGKYLVHWPVYITGEDKSAKMFIVLADIFSKDQIDIVSDSVADDGRRRYISAQVKLRLHQQEFREKVLLAYHEHCTICSLHHRELLDAAHIIEDKDGGEPVVQNGLSLCKLHHAAFDKYILGINPDYYIEVRKDILDEINGPMLKYGLQKLHSQKIFLPSRLKWPNKEWLEKRYEKFKHAS